VCVITKLIVTVIVLERWRMVSKSDVSIVIFPLHFLPIKWIIAKLCALVVLWLRPFR